ncbi:hypothetical protein [Janthinobacterium sp. LB3P118]|uniref:hypothetical protein n=1 Tax=Janthinobacterium sp. LB3P118 TaxID=3424195 RepID=UPI003F25C018
MSRQNRKPVRAKGKTRPVPYVNRKSGPFLMPKLSEEYGGYAHLLADALSTIPELPDFSQDSKVAIFSDFGGENNEADFNTYSFLIMAYNKVGPFQDAVHAMRERHGIKDHYSEFRYKRLDNGARFRALPQYLEIIDRYIHGAVITVAVDKSIKTLFGPTKGKAHAHITKILAEKGLGAWDGATAEKLMRICHAAAAFTSVTTHPNQRLLWYCDNDAINAQGNSRGFKDTQGVFLNVLDMYCPHGFEILGFAKSFTDKSHLDDLLSVADFAAGVVQDLLKSHKTGIDFIPDAGKTEVIKWIARESPWLSKITIQLVSLPGGGVGQGLVHFTPPSQSGDDE